MTETVKSTQDGTLKDSTPPQSSAKTSSKALKPSNDGNEGHKHPSKNERPQTKVVVRRLPPTMTLETFVEQVSPLPPVDYMYFVKADANLTPFSYSRAYLHFIHVNDMLIFTEKFDNYVFVDAKGNEYPAVVEYAPFQRIPRLRSSRKKDPRSGTIENDPYYLEFIEALKAEEIQRKSASKTNKQHFFETSAIPGTTTEKVTSTPLLEFLKARRAEKFKSREDRLVERKKREVERRKAREDTRNSGKHIKGTEVEDDSAASPQVKIAAHGPGSERIHKDSVDTKRSTKEYPTKDVIVKRREDERLKSREKDRDRKEREKDPKELRDKWQEQRRDLKFEKKRDSAPETTKDHDTSQDKETDKESLSSEARGKEIKKVGKSYQEERQRLNERRQAVKNSYQKNSTSFANSKKAEKGDENVGDSSISDSKVSSDKNRGSDHSRLHNAKDTKKPERVNKFQNKEQEHRRFGKSVEDRSNDDKTEKQTISSSRNVPENKQTQHKEEVRKKSYNQEREQRRAAERKVPAKKDSVHGSKSDDKVGTSKDVTSSKSDTSLDTKLKSGEKTSAVEVKPSQSEHQKACGDNADKDVRGSQDSGCKPEAESSTSQGAGGEARSDNFKEGEKDKKDPRAERRIRNKDRPSIEIYRPGMGRFSRQRLEREKGVAKGSSTERDSPSPSAAPCTSKSTVASEKSEK